MLFIALFENPVPANVSPPLRMNVFSRMKKKKSKLNYPVTHCIEKDSTQLLCFFTAAQTLDVDYITEVVDSSH